MLHSGSKVCFTERIIDEIALEGLEGTTLATLWLNIANSMNFKSELGTHLKSNAWEFIKQNAQNFQFFRLPKERETLPVFNRFETRNLDEEFGIPISLTQSKLPRYKLNPKQCNEIMGSCEHFTERVEISPAEIKKTTLDDAIQRWGNKLVIVASQELRVDALMPKTILFPKDITIQQYAILEVIGRSRANGETTSGSASLQDFFKDANLIYYIKTRLIKMGLIVAQPLTEMNNSRFMNYILLTLPRFYTAHKNALTSMMEKVFLSVKETPDATLPLVEIRKLFPVSKKKKSFQRILNTPEFKEIFDVKSVPVSGKKDKPSLKTESTETEGDTPSKRTMIMVALRNPQMQLSEIFSMPDEKGENEDANESIEVVDGKDVVGRLAYVDMALKDQFYNAIFIHGPEGISQSQLTSALDVHPFATRQIVQNLTQQKLISVFIKSVGRQRVQMYVANPFSSIVADFNEKKRERQNLKCSDEPNIPADFLTAEYQENPDFTATIKEFRYVVKEATEITYQQATRMAIIVEALNENCLIHVPDITKKINAAEIDTDASVCRKSVSRILNHLCKQGTVQMYQAIVKCQSRGDLRIHHFVTHPKIHIEHEVIKKELERLKNTLFVRMEFISFRDSSKQQALKQKERQLIDRNVGVGDGSGNKLSAVLDKTDREAIQRMPKFLVSRYMHEFLFYIVVELNEFQRPLEINLELVQHWKASEPSLQTKEFLSLIKTKDSAIKAYTKEISWRTFIPPLKTYSDKPAGWVYLLDAMDRMPLSLFMKIFRLENNLNQNLEDILKHPIRQHYVISQLPIELCTLINRVYMEKVFLTILKLLNNMGLVQVSDPNVSKTDKLKMWAYFNRKANIIDTTSSGIGYSTVDQNINYETLRYEFKTFDDVHNYWMSLQRICVYTKLGFRKNVEREKQRIKEITFLKPVPFDEAHGNDVGYIPGDQTGAAGLSMQLFAHRFRNWSWALHANTKPTMMTTIRRNGSGGGFGSNRNKLLKIRRTTVAARKKSTLSIGVLSRMMTTTAGVGNSVGAGFKRPPRLPRDSFDCEALKNKQSRRVNWTPEEDIILKIGRAVYIYMASPFLYLHLTVVAKMCRDIIRQVLGIRTKTVESCRRRDQFMYKNNRHLPEVPMWVDMLRSNTEIESKYGRDFLNSLKLAYPNRAELCEALEIHFVHLMCFVYKTVNRLGKTMHPVFCIPDSIVDFRHLYAIRAANKSDNPAPEVQHNNPLSEAELHVSVAYSLLHSLMCCARDKNLYMPQAFELFKSFSEDILSIAFAKARKDGLAVNHKRGNLRASLAPTQLAGPSYVLSSKYRFTLVFLRLPYHIFDAVYETLKKALSIFYGPTTSSSAIASQARSYELKSMHIGHLFFAGEGIAQNYWSIVPKLPTRILIEDPEDTALEKQLSSSQSSAENANTADDCPRHSESDTGDKRMPIKFQRSVTSANIYYTPYDVISKLPIRKLHFFCALDHIQKNVEINLNRLQQRQDDELNTFECPFKCVMKNSNYLDAIERIVHEKKQFLTQLVDGPSHKLNNPSTFVNSVKVNQTNLLGIVRMLEAIGREKDEIADRKDFGKKSIAHINRQTVMDWQKLCQEILDFKDNNQSDDYFASCYDKNDDYEAALSKDDRLRDTMVVNFPLLKMTTTSFINSCPTTEHNGLTLPQVLCEAETQRKEIIQKIERDALWTYTEETVSSLLAKSDRESFSLMEQKHITEIHDYISSRKFGVTLQELMLEFRYKTFLRRALQFLSENFLIKRVGVAVHIYVHQKNLRDWLVQTFHITRRDHENLKATQAMKKRKLAENTSHESASKRLPRKRIKLEDVNTVDEAVVETAEVSTTSALKEKKNVIVLRPRPWIRLNGSLNRRVIDRWLGSVLSECIARSGITVLDLSQHFLLMYPADVHFLLEILCMLKCVQLKELKEDQANLFSLYTPPKESAVNEICDPARTYVTAQADAVMRLTNFIGEKKYTADFI